jgi:hypothetical protein
LYQAANSNRCAYTATVGDPVPASCPSAGDETVVATVSERAASVVGQARDGPLTDRPRQINLQRAGERRFDVMLEVAADRQRGRLGGGLRHILVERRRLE